MKTTPILSPAQVNWAQIATQALQADGVIAIPTESSYGMAVFIDRPQAIKRLFTLKNRPLDKPLPILISNLEQLYPLVDEISPVTQRLMARFWPGPLTFIIPSKEIPLVSSLKPATLAVRLTNCAIAKTLIEYTRQPVTATSANLSGKPNAYSPDEVLNYFDGKIEALVDGGILPPNPVSTILDMSTTEPRIVRQGAISSEVIWRVLASEASSL